MPNSTEHEILTSHKLKHRQMNLSLLDVVFIMLINVKMPTIVGILRFMSRIISCSAELSMEKVL